MLQKEGQGQREREREIKMSGTRKVCRAETLLEVHLKGE